MDTSGDPRRAVAGPWLSPVNGSAEIRPYGELRPRGLTAGLRRLVRRALRWYLWPVTAAMSRHNAAVSAVIAENRRQLARLDMEAERLDRDLDLLRPRSR